MSKRQGFSLAELIIALGLFAVAILSILGLSILIGKASQEADDRTIGSVVASSLADRLIDQLRSDAPPGTRASFWDNEFGSANPWEEGTLNNDGTEYQYRILASSVTDSSGDPVGGTTPNNRLKKVDISVWWWGDENQQHQGYGTLKVISTRLVSEGEM